VPARGVASGAAVRGIELRIVGEIERSCSSTPEEWSGGNTDDRIARSGNLTGSIEWNRLGDILEIQQVRTPLPDIAQLEG
jgi:hypothetical protein